MELEIKLQNVIYVSTYERLKINQITSYYGVNVKNVLYKGKRIVGRKAIKNFKILKGKKNEKINYSPNYSYYFYNPL